MAAFIVIEKMDGSFVYTRPAQVQTLYVEDDFEETRSHADRGKTHTVVAGPNLRVCTKWTPQEVMALVEEEA